MTQGLVHSAILRITGGQHQVIAHLQIAGSLQSGIRAAVMGHVSMGCKRSADSPSSRWVPAACKHPQAMLPTTAAGHDGQGACSRCRWRCSKGHTSCSYVASHQAIHQTGCIADAGLTLRSSRDLLPSAGISA